MFIEFSYYSGQNLLVKTAFASLLFEIQPTFASQMFLNFCLISASCFLWTCFLKTTTCSAELAEIKNLSLCMQMKKEASVCIPNSNAA